jgi:hypothetical protein
MIWRMALVLLLAGPVWHREPVTLRFPTAVWIRVNEGDWVHSAEVWVAQEGVNKVSIRKSKGDPAGEEREVMIDVTPPVVALTADPPIDQQGGLYSGTPETRFSLEASDALSGVKSLEIGIDGKYAPYRKPIQLPPGTHELRCRATDVAGNQNEVMTGETLGSGGAAMLQIEIK